MSDPIFTAAPQTNPFGLSDVGESATPTFVDIDGDGLLDAFIGNKYGIIEYFHNIGSGTAPSFVTEVGIGLVDPGNYAKPAFVDIDGDGDLDAFVGTQDGTVRYYKNIGSKAVPSFSEEAANFGLTDVGYSASPTFADIDGDGDLDAFVGAYNGNVAFFRNTGTKTAPNFSVETDNFGIADVGLYVKPSFADIDGDGDLDAFVGNGNDGTIHFFRNTGSATAPSFVSSANFGIPSVGQYAAPSFADIDGDGDLDAFVSNSNGDTLFFRNDQAGVRITPSGGKNTVTEGGATDTYTVVLNRQPTANVTITLDNTNNQINTDKITLIFTSANWNVAQTVTLTAVNDTVGEGKHTGVIKHTVTSTDADYNGLVIKPAVVAIADNDLPKVINPSFLQLSLPPGLSSTNGIPVAGFADIDGDGDIDVFVGGSDGTTTLFRNTGTTALPSFASQSNSFGLTDVGVSAAPTFADIDGDGDLDAFVGERYGSIVFFRNNGSALTPSFVSEANNFGLTQESGSARPAFADIDDDGDLDAFVGTGDGSLRFFRNDGTANAPSFLKQSSNFGLSSVGLSASPSFADLDGDGDLDAVIGKNDGSTLYFKNLGNAANPNFAVVGTNVFGLNIPALDEKYTALTFADLDGDGDIDALSASNLGLNYFVNALPGVTVRQSGDSTTVTEAGATDSYTIVLGSIPTADVTITLDNTNNQISTNITTLTFTAANWNIPQTVTITAVNDSIGEGKHTGVIKHTVTSADTTYNGMVIKPVTVTISDNDLPISNPTFNSSVFSAFGLQDVGYAASPVFADIDGDGDLDAFVGNQYGETRFFRNTGSATAPSFSFQSNFGLSDVGYNAAPSFADIDNDGDLDAFVGNNDGNIQFFRNTGTALAPRFVAQTATLGLSDVGSKADPTFADIDNDGDLDAFIGKASSGAISFFRNTGTATAAKFVSEANSFGLIVSSNNSPTLADWDGDGDLDAVVSSTGGITFFRNTGTLTNPNFVSQTSQFGLSVDGSLPTPTLVDIDGDGDLDAFVGYLYGESVFYRNNIPGIKITQSGGNTTVTEGGATDSYSVVLSSQPSANVVITLDNTNNQVNTNKTTLTFTAANWNVAQTVTLTAVNDTAGEGTHSGVIKHTVTSTDTSYNGFAVKPLVVTIIDNDLAVGNPNFKPAVLSPFGLQQNIEGFMKPTLADIDGDGDLDLFVGLRYGGILFHRNTGTTKTPNFVSSTSNFGLTNVGGYVAPTFGDIDGDGDLDAFVGANDGKVHFFRNTGTALAPNFVSQSGNFGMSGITPGYANPDLADIDGDGDLDAFVGDSNGITHFFRNVGTVNAASFVKLANNFGIGDVGDFHASPSLADIDGDGDLDAMVGDFNGNTQFFINKGTALAPSFVKATGNFGLGEVHDYASPTFVDIDGDGDLDAFIGDDPFNTDLSFFKNTSANFITIAQSGGKTAVVEGGATDIVSVVLKAAPTANVTITLDASNGQVTTNKTTLLFTPLNWNVAQAVTVTAVNDSVGEGKHTGAINLIASSTDARYNNGDVLSVAVTIDDNDLPKADPQFAATVFNPFGLSFEDSFVNATFVDIDGDGDLDAVAGVNSFDPNGNHGKTLFLKNVGSAASPQFNLETSDFGITRIAGFTANTRLVDIDGDGDLDAFVGGRDGLNFFRNTGTAKAPVFASEGNTFGIVKTTRYASVGFADIDNDGDLDAFVGNNDGTTQFYRNTGTATAPIFVSATSNFGITDVGYSAKPTFADIDGDGDLDAFVGKSDGNTAFFRNVGTATLPSFASQTGNFGVADVGSNAAPTFADIDGDGDIDAFVGNNNGEIRFFENTVRSRPVLAAPADIVYTDTKFDDTFATKTGTLTATDANGDILTYGIQGGTDLGNGTVSLVNSFGTLTITKATGAYSFVANDAVIEALAANSVTNFTVTVSDGLLSGSQTLTLRINQSGITETNGNDNLVGTAANEKFNTLNGSDTINGGGGTDTMTGGLGNDTYVVDNIGDTVIETSALATEIDLVQSSVSFTLSANVENLVLTGGNAVNGTGNALNNAITGNSGANTLNGRLGVDTMTGGLGNDIYVVDNIGDTVIETSALATEIDLVQSSVSFTLGANVENITLTGTTNINGTGNALSNAITGNSGANTLNGRLGADTMRGGLGNDTYIVDNVVDTVIETSALAAEIDLVQSSVSYTLSANVENLTLLGSAAINGTGNNLANTIVGNAAANLLNGGLGNDILTGGLGNDIFRLTTLTNDRITDFNVLNDTIQLENAVFTQLTTAGVLSANHFKIGAATDADDHILYNTATGSLVYDSNGNVAGGATQIAVLGIGLALTNADFVVI